MTYADNKDHHFTVVGVVKNYHFRSLHWRIEPLVFIYSPDSCRVLFAKLNSDDMTQSIEYIEKVWKKYASGFPLGDHVGVVGIQNFDLLGVDIHNN